MIKTSKPLNTIVNKFKKKHISERVSLYIPVMDSARAVADSDTGYMAKRRHTGPRGVWVKISTLGLIGDTYKDIEPDFFSSSLSIFRYYLAVSSMNYFSKFMNSKIEVNFRLKPEQRP